MTDQQQPHERDQRVLPPLKATDGTGVRQQQPLPSLARTAPLPARHQYLGPGPLPPERPSSEDPEGPSDHGPEQRTDTAVVSSPVRRQGSPITAPGALPAVLTATLAGLLAAASALGRPALAVAALLLQAVTAAGWFRLNGMWPARQGIALAFAAGLTADVALLAIGVESAPAVIIGTLGVWGLLILVLQLRSHSDPDERLYALTAAVAATLLTVVATGWLAGVADAVVVGAVGVGVATLARAVPLPPVVASALALLAATGVGVLAARVTELGDASGALLGLAAGASALLGLRVASYDFPSRFVHMTAGVALPLTVAAPVVYGLGHLLG